MTNRPYDVIEGACDLCRLAHQAAVMARLPDHFGPNGRLLTSLPEAVAAAQKIKVEFPGPGPVRCVSLPTELGASVDVCRTCLLTMAVELAAPPRPEGQS